MTSNQMFTTAIHDLQLLIGDGRGIDITKNLNFRFSVSLKYFYNQSLIKFEFQLVPLCTTFLSSNQLLYIRNHHAYAEYFAKKYDAHLPVILQHYFNQLLFIIYILVRLFSICRYM